MLTGAVARRYALAFFSIAYERQAIDQLEGELRFIVEAIAENPELSRVMAHQFITSREKTRLVEQVFAGKISPITMNLLKVVLEKRRESYLADILKEFGAYASEAKKIIDVEAKTAVALPEVLSAELKAKLEETTGKQVRLKVSIDPDLIGGLVVKIGDKVIDGSISRRLDNLKEQMRRTEFKQ
jgi:F-type H+-transporting ATPase subunit delta